MISDQLRLAVNAIEVPTPSVFKDPYYFSLVSEFARTYVADQITYIRAQFQASNSPYRESVMAELLELENAIPDMEYAFE
jgi:hypothetical protein